MDAVDSNFYSTSARQAYSALKAQLWSAIDSEINLADCDIYRQVLVLCAWAWVRVRVRVRVCACVEAEACAEAWAST